MIRASRLDTKGTLPMPRLLQYVSGVRLVVDVYDHRLWHFTIRGRRFDLRERGGSYVLQTDDGTKLGSFDDWDRAIVIARDHAHRAITERIPVIAPVARPQTGR